tara:strand:- start:284 stop:1087 length:804 start_codon:yes stop_codon:yes gene_type:complete
MLYHQKLLVVILASVFITGTGQALHSGVGGNANGQGEVTLAGCTCHADSPDNSVTVILDGVPFHYSPETAYVMKIQLIGGPEADTDSYTGGFSMRASSGSLSESEGYAGLVQNWEGDQATLTHTDAGASTPDRTWVFTWTSPQEGTGAVTFSIAGNSVNGDMAPSSLDRWNRLTASVDEGQDNGRIRTVFSGNGEINPPAPVEEHKDLHHMGAKLLAHWLGLLGFTAVILVILFCGLFLRYGFSRHYAGRSNLLKLRIKHLRRGDQL